MFLPHRRRRMQRNDQGVVCLRMYFRCRRRLRAGPCAHAARSPAACGCRSRPPGLEFTVTPTTAVAAKPSGGMEQPGPGSAAVARERQRALAIDDAAAAVRRATTFLPMACHAPGAAAVAAATLAAVQGTAPRAAAASTRVLQPVPANAAGKAQPIAPAMASNDAGAASSRCPVDARCAAAAAARSALAGALRLQGAVQGW